MVKWIYFIIMAHTHTVFPRAKSGLLKNWPKKKFSSMLSPDLALGNTVCVCAIIIK